MPDGPCWTFLNLPPTNIVFPTCATARAGDWVMLSVLALMPVTPHGVDSDGDDESTCGSGSAGKPPSGIVGQVTEVILGRMNTWVKAMARFSLAYCHR